MYSYNYMCFDCRNFKGRLSHNDFFNEINCICQFCNKDMFRVSYKLRPPKKNSIKN